MLRISQQDRLRAALAELSATHPGRSLTTRERNAYALRLLDSKWFRKTFTMTRWSWTPGWRGSDELNTLHELSCYLMPRALWAQRREKGEGWVRREMAWSLLTLVQHKMGRDAAKTLRAAFVKNGVKYRPRRIITAAQKAALRSRAFGKKPKVEQPIQVTFSVNRDRPKLAPAQAGRRRISFTEE